jgi:nitrogen regulatory protein PII
MTQVELTQEELDLIQAKRDQQAAKDQQKLDRINADIVKAKANIARRQEEDKKQNAAARAFQKELGEGWEEQTKEEERTEKVYLGMEVMWSETYTDCRVYLVNGNYKVHVNEHTVYSGTWGRGNNKGYKMFVSGPEIEWAYSQKALSKAATVNKKVQEAIDTINAREEAKKKKASVVETAVHDLQVAYPTAKVLATRDWTRGYSTRVYREYDKITIGFTNGIQVTYEVYSDGRLSRLGVDFGGLEHNEVLNALTAIPPHISE